MRKALYSIMTHIPVFGPIYEMKTKPLFCSPGIADGTYDQALRLIDEYQKQHPDEQITRQLVEKLVRES